MFDFLSSVFSGIGFAIAIIGITYGSMSLMDKIRDASKQRKERFARLLTALERIEQNTRKPN
jgi:hypothetical protein